MHRLKFVKKLEIATKTAVEGVGHTVQGVVQVAQQGAEGLTNSSKEIAKVTQQGVKGVAKATQQGAEGASRVAKDPFGAKASRRALVDGEEGSAAPQPAKSRGESRVAREIRGGEGRAEAMRMARNNSGAGLAAMAGSSIKGFVKATQQGVEGVETAAKGMVKVTQQGVEGVAKATQLGVEGVGTAAKGMVKVTQQGVEGVKGLAGSRVHGPDDAAQTDQFSALARYRLDDLAEEGGDAPHVPRPSLGARTISRGEGSRRLKTDPKALTAVRDGTLDSLEGVAKVTQRITRGTMGGVGTAAAGVGTAAKGALDRSLQAVDVGVRVRVGSRSVMYGSEETAPNASDGSDGGLGEYLDVPQPDAIVEEDSDEEEDDDYFSGTINPPPRHAHRSRTKLMHTASGRIGFGRASSFRSSWGGFYGDTFSADSFDSSGNELPRWRRAMWRWLCVALLSVVLAAAVGILAFAAPVRTGQGAGNTREGGGAVLLESAALAGSEEAAPGGVESTAPTPSSSASVSVGAAPTREDATRMSQREQIQLAEWIHRRCHYHQAACQDLCREKACCFASKEAEEEEGRRRLRRRGSRRLDAGGPELGRAVLPGVLPPPPPPPGGAGESYDPDGGGAQEEETPSATTTAPDYGAITGEQEEGGDVVTTVVGASPRAANCVDDQAEHCMTYAGCAPFFGQ